MSAQNCSEDRIDLLRWTAGLGAVTGESLACRRGVSVASARATLTAAVRAKQLVRHRPLADRPALYTITRRGLHAAMLVGVEPCRVSAASAQHMIACAHVAAALQHRYPDQLVIGERELRRREREAGAPLASVVLRRTGGFGALMHRPDLVLLSRSKFASAAGGRRGRVDDKGAATACGDLPRLGKIAPRAWCALSGSARC